MQNTLLNIGGIAQIILGLFHIYLSTAIQKMDSLTAGGRALMQMLNVGGTMLIFFVAYATFFQRDDLLSTSLGRTTLIFVTLFYLVRAAEEIIFRQAAGFSLVIFVVCLAVAGLYAGALALKTACAGSI